MAFLNGEGAHEAELPNPAEEGLLGESCIERLRSRSLSGKFSSLSSLKSTVFPLPLPFPFERVSPASIQRLTSGVPNVNPCFLVGKGVIGSPSTLGKSGDGVRLSGMTGLAAVGTGGTEDL